MRIRLPALALSFALLGAIASWPAAAQPAPMPQVEPSLQQRTAMLKAWLQASQAQMRAYEWIETTVVTQGGEEKSRTMKRCYYGPNGQLQKMLMQQTSAQMAEPPGILPFGRLARRVEESAKEEAKAYMQNAVELVHSYVPPNQGYFQRAIDAGQFGLQMLGPTRVRLNFSNYLKQGDAYAVDVARTTNQLLGLVVNTYLDGPADPVVLNVSTAVMPDGTIYNALAVLSASAKGLQVTVQNSGFNRVAP